MKLKSKTTATLLIAIFMISTFAVAIPVFADAHLIAVGETGSEDSIVIEMPEGFTLGDLVTLSWEEYLVKGYPPHVDVILGNGESLNFEYAYNDVSHYAEVPHIGDEAFGALTGVWYSTFGDDGNGPTVIDDSSMAWPNSGAPGPYPSEVFQLFTLAEWKAGITTLVGDKLIDASKSVTRLEIEVDNWVKDTEAYVRNILINGQEAAEVSLDVSVIPAIISISVSPTAVNFGPIIVGGDSAVEVVTVSNTGNVVAYIDADIDSVWYQTYLQIDYVAYGSWDLGSISATSSEGYDLQLVAVQDIGTHSGVLVFEATPEPPP